MTEEKRSLFKEHKLGISMSVVVTLITIIGLNVYDTFRSSFEASVATGQANDSIVEYSLIQKLVVSNLGDTLIVGIGALFAILLIFPTIIDAVKKPNQ